MMEDNSELLIQKAGAICTLVINRPQKKNLLTASCLQKIAQTLEDLAGKTTIRVVVIRGVGNEAFSAGYDITALPTDPSKELADSLKETPPLELACRAIQRFPYPVIAMINGFAYGGGCELAVSCDIRVAVKHAKMGMPPAKLGIVYPYSGYRRFMTVLGFSRTLELFLTGRHYDSMRCLHMGLVNYVIEEQELESFTYDLAGEISENAPISLKGTKFALYKIAAYPQLDKKDEEQLQSLFVRSLGSQDLKEGKLAFKEKRKPRFTGE